MAQWCNSKIGPCEGQLQPEQSLRMSLIAGPMTAMTVRAHLWFLSSQTDLLSSPMR